MTTNEPPKAAGAAVPATEAPKPPATGNGEAPKASESAGQGECRETFGIGVHRYVLQFVMVQTILVMPDLRRFLFNRCPARFTIALWRV